MINRAYKISSTWKSFIDECESLKQTFINLRYPLKLIDATINKSINKFISSDTTNEVDTTDERRPRIIQRNNYKASFTRIGVSLQPVFTSVEIGNILKTREKKNRHC